MEMEEEPSTSYWDGRKKNKKVKVIFQAVLEYLLSVELI